MLCDTNNHENRHSSSIFLKTRKSSKLDFLKAYVCQVQTKVYIHIQNITSPQMYMHEGTWLKECKCIINSLDKMDIYMKLKTHNHKNISKMGI